MGTQHTVLLIEDHELLRQALATALEQAGYRVVVAGGAIEAVKRFVEDRPAVAVMDVRLPDAAGTELGPALRSLDAEHLPIVWITGEPDRAAAAARAGDVVLTKPFSTGDLLNALRRLLAGAAGPPGFTKL